MNSGPGPNPVRRAGRRVAVAGLQPFSVRRGCRRVGAKARDFSQSSVRLCVVGRQAQGGSGLGLGLRQRAIFHQRISQIDMGRRQIRFQAQGSLELGNGFGSLPLGKTAPSPAGCVPQRCRVRASAPVRRRRARWPDHRLAPPPVPGDKVTRPVPEQAASGRLTETAKVSRHVPKATTHRRIKRGSFRMRPWFRTAG